jgi:outer membrane beta-barrel protein
MHSKRRHASNWIIVSLWVAGSLAAFGGLTSSPALGADADRSSSGGSSAAPNSLDAVGSEAERLNIENIKQKYWARGDESELGVVQNRMYTKARKFELGVYAGVIATDPFLSVYSLNASLGYHFNEYLSVAVFGTKDWATPSSALVFLRNPYPNGAGSDTSTNEPKWFVGAEAMASVLYGKLSLVGKAIIHYDFHFLGGLGVTNTESGKYFTPSFGVGQQFYITRWMTLRTDYRLMIFNETILQKVGSPSSPVGTPIGSRTNFSNSVSVGLSFLIDPFGKKAPAEDTSAAGAGARPVK